MAADQNMKILVCYDSGTMRVMFKQMLNKAGFKNIVVAINGKWPDYPGATECLCSTPGNKMGWT
jgi:hypothetical protein